MTEPAVVAAVAADAPAPPVGPCYTILCVDDEVNILATLRRLLTRRGYAVLSAESGAAGLQILASTPVHLVISDMRMPEMDGAEFLQTVRQRWPDTVRLLLTGFADIPAIINAINNGEIYRYITKPWDEAELLLTVRRALERIALESDKRRLELQVRQQNEALQQLNSALETKVLARTEDLHVANARLKKNYLNTIKAFSSLMDLRGGDLSGHARLLANLARRTAANMQLPEAAQQEIFVAGLLHDVGKIGLSDAILMRPVGRLGKDDMLLYQRHPAWGEMALMALDDMQGVAALIRAHHERFDGLGFPDRLSGAQLSLSAHILIVAEAYLDMQSGSLSEAKLSPAEAAAMVARGRGSQFHPEVVDVFLQVALNAVPDAQVPCLMLATAELSAGMVLGRDLLVADGLVLLGADHVLSDKLIRLLRLREQRDGLHFVLAIKKGGKP
jgi:response regulator RpfG family c-di-GMP phosphodiesterase